MTISNNELTPKPREVLINLMETGAQGLKPHETASIIMKCLDCLELASRSKQENASELVIQTCQGAVRKITTDLFVQAVSEGKLDPTINLFESVHELVGRMNSDELKTVRTMISPAADSAYNNFGMPNF